MPTTPSYGFIIPIPRPNPKDVYHADFIPKSLRYRTGRMKGQRVICFTNRMVRLNGNILRRFILHRNETSVGGWNPEVDIEGSLWKSLAECFFNSFSSCEPYCEGVRGWNQHDVITPFMDLLGYRQDQRIKFCKHRQKEKNNRKSPQMLDIYYHAE